MRNPIDARPVAASVQNMGKVVLIFDFSRSRIARKKKANPLKRIRPKENKKR